MEITYMLVFLSGMVTELILNMFFLYLFDKYIKKK